MTYDLRSLSLPRLGSTGLRLLVAALRFPLVGRWLVAKIRRDGGLDRLATAVVNEPPTFLPHQPSDDPGIPPLVPHDANDSPYLDQPSAPPTPPGFRFPAAADYADAYRRGRRTPEDVARAFLGAWRASDAGPRPIRAFIAVREDDLMAQAAASAERWRAGKPLGPWDGVPVAIKDEVDVAGYATTLGTRILAGTRAEQDATVVARLRAAGALIVGKANMHEIGINITGLNPHYGTVRNPYDDRRHSGGSSSGPAAAVAAGLVPVAIGADGGGSIRIPSSFCGVVGIKPTFGRISEAGVPDLVWSMAYLGPIAGTVQDCAAAYALVAGDDGRDPRARNHPSVNLDVALPGSLRGITLGVYRPWFSHAERGVVTTCEEMVECFRDEGATVVDVEIPELDLQRVAHAAIITAEMSAAMARHAARWNELGLEARSVVRLAGSSSGAELMTAMRVRTRAMALWRAAFANVHAIVTPATGIVAPLINPAAIPDGGSDLGMTTEAMRFAYPSNLTGHPAISFPAGYDASGAPVGMQVIGRPWSERLLFRIAAFAELEVERRKPQRWYSTLDA